MIARHRPMKRMRLVFLIFDCRWRAVDQYVHFRSTLNIIEFESRHATLEKWMAAQQTLERSDCVRYLHSAINAFLRSSGRPESNHSCSADPNHYLFSFATDSNQNLTCRWICVSISLSSNFQWINCLINLAPRVIRHYITFNRIICLLPVPPVITTEQKIVFIK